MAKGAFKGNYNRDTGNWLVIKAKLRFLNPLGNNSAVL